MKAFWIIFPALIIAVPAFADKKDEVKFSPGPASSYASKQTNEHVTIAVKAYDTEELAHTAFGKLNPYQYGILPVLVVVQNDSDQSLRLDGLQVQYTGYDGKQIDATPAADVPYAVEGPRRPGPGGPMPLPIPPELRKKHKNPLSGPEIQTRAFSARMLPPHDTAYGFVYFQAHHRPGDSVYISGIREASTGRALFYFEIPLKD
jgi:hypothetical protein